MYVTDSWGTPSATGLTNTIVVSHAVGVQVTTGSTATLNGVLWYGNTVANTGGSGAITVANVITGNPALAVDATI